MPSVVVGAAEPDLATALVGTWEGRIVLRPSPRPEPRSTLVARGRA